MRHGLPHPDPLARGQKLREGDLARSHFGDDRFRRRLRRVGDGRRERAGRATQLSGRHERVRGCVRHARERPFVNIRIAHGVEALVGSGGVDARTEALCGPLVARRLCRVRLRLVGVVEELRGVELLGGDGLSRTVGSHVRDGQHMRAGDWSSGAYLGGDPRLVHLASNVRRVEAAHFAAGGRSDGRRTAATCNEPEEQPGARPLLNSTRKGPALYISDPPRPTPPAPPYTLVPPACARSHILVLATRTPPRYTPYTQHPKYRRLCERSCCRPVQRQPCTNARAALLHATVSISTHCSARARRVTPPVARLRACSARASPQRAPCHIKPRHLLGACTPWLTGCTGARRPFRRS